jgi:imidazolonepropionase-like amidohydrolase
VSAERAVAIRAPLAWLGPGRLVEDALVVARGGLISYAGPASGWEAPADVAGEEFRIDGFVMPAVADSHVHIGLSGPGEVLRGGVARVRDLAWPPAMIHALARESEDEAAFDGPLIRAVGPMVTAHGGYPSRAFWAPNGTAVEIRGIEEAEAATRLVLAEGSAGAVKVALNAESGPVLRDDELVAVCETAHSLDAIVTVHAQGAGQAERALGAGADEFAHCPWSERLADDVVHAMARSMRVVSTLNIHSYGQSTPELDVALDNLRRFVQAGGRVAYGTDLGNGPIPAGIDAHEAMLLEAAGVQDEQLLVAMTEHELAPGAPADLIGLAANPLDDVREIGGVIFVMRGGRRIR